MKKHFPQQYDVPIIPEGHLIKLQELIASTENKLLFFTKESPQNIWLFNIIMDIQESLFKTQKKVSVVHVYDCKDSDVNTNIVGPRPKNEYHRIVLYDKDMCVILFNPKDNHVAQTPPHSHKPGVKALVSVGPGAVEISLECEYDMPDVPNTSTRVTLNKLCIAKSEMQLIETNVPKHLVLFASKTFFSSLGDSSLLNLINSNYSDKPNAPLFSMKV